MVRAFRKSYLTVQATSMLPRKNSEKQAPGEDEYVKTAGFSGMHYYIEYGHLPVYGQVPGGFTDHSKSPAWKRNMDTLEKSEMNIIKG